MKEIPDNWSVANEYERFMGRWSRQVARGFISWLNPPPGWTWLDVGCGTGALTQAICQDAHPASVVACDPSAGFVSYAHAKIDHPAVTFLVASADELPVAPAGFNAVVSGLVLNFIPDPQEALHAMLRRLQPGGTLAAYVWDYADGMQFLRIFWEAAVELDSQAALLDERQRFLMCHPDALVGLLNRLNLQSIETQALEIDTPFPGYDHYWASFQGGTGPAPAYVASLSPQAREQLRLNLKQRLNPAGGGPLRLTARAWAVRGSAPA